MYFIFISTFNFNCVLYGTFLTKSVVKMIKLNDYVDICSNNEQITIFF